MTYLEPDSDHHQIHEWVAPDVCDDRGFVRPGTALEWLNAAGARAAARFAHAPVTTIAVDGVRVLRRIATGDRIAMRARVVHATARSIGVAVAMSAGQRGPALDAFMTFVVVGSDGRAARVPRFYPRSFEELAGHHEAEARVRFRRDLATEIAPQLWSCACASPPPAPASATRLVLLLRARVSYVPKVEACAAMSAAAYFSAPPRLLGVEALTFQQPVVPPALVHLDARAVHSDDLGVTVMVTGRSEDVHTAATASTVRGFFTYAPVDPTRAIPRLARIGRDEALFCEVTLRHRLREALTELRS